MGLNIMLSNKKWLPVITPILVIVVISLMVAGSYLLISRTSSVSQAVVLFASSIAAAASIGNTYYSYQNSVRLEELKQKMNLRLPALQETTNAAVRYYYTLSELESGKFEQEQVSKSEEEMKKVTGKIFFLGKDYQKAWYAYWQKARYISESVDSQQDIEASQADWKTKWSKDLSTLLENLTLYQEGI
jgi:hypothetical protein